MSAVLTFSKNFCLSLYLRPPAQLRLPEHKILNFSNPFYGLLDVLDYCNRWMAAHLEEDIALLPSLSDMFLFFWINSHRLQRLIGFFVDDITVCVNDAFLSLSRQMFQNLIIGSQNLTILNFLLFAPIQCLLAWSSRKYYRSLAFPSSKILIALGLSLPSWEAFLVHSHTLVYILSGWISCLVY